MTFKVKDGIAVAGATLVNGNNDVTAKSLTSNTTINIGTTTVVDSSTNISANSVTAKTLTSNVATGTAPLTVSSTTAVTNLNADLLDGQHGAYYSNASNLNAGTLPVARLPALTGDATSSAGNNTLTLANTGVTAGSYGNSSSVPVLTIDAKGRVTNASQTAVAGVSGYSYASSNNTFTITTSAGSSFNAKIDQVSDFTITGNLTVSGTTTYVNSTELNIGDNQIVLNADLPGSTAPSQNAGLTVNRGSAANVEFVWNETDDTWAIGNTNVTGFVNVSTTLQVTGVATFSNNVTVAGNLTVSGTDNGTDKLQVNGTILGTELKGTTLTSTVATGTSPFTISSTTTVPNLSADMIDGLHVHTGTNNEANKIVRTDGSGYIQAGYLNSGAGNENNASSPPRVWGTNGSDSYLRTYQTAYLSVGSATTATNIAGGAAGNIHYQSGAGTTAFVTNGTAGQVLTSNGTAAPYWATPSVSSMTVTDDVSTASAVYPAWVGGTSGSQALKVSSTKISFVPSSGNLTAAGSITAFSDARLKTEVTPIENAVEKVQTLEGVTYTRTDSGDRQTGLIAQAVQKVLPEAVVESPDGYLSLAYGNMVGLLVQAIKEQQQQIDALKAEINDLKGKA